MDKKIYEIYVLIDKYGEVRYIGSTCHPEQRKAAHRQDWRRRGWTYEMWKIVGEDEAAAREQEKELIRAFTRAGADLVNGVVYESLDDRKFGWEEIERSGKGELSSEFYLDVIERILDRAEKRGGEISEAENSLLQRLLEKFR